MVEVIQNNEKSEVSATPEIILVKSIHPAWLIDSGLLRPV